MPISTTTNTVLLAGNSSTVVFPYSFPFYNLSDLQVYLYDTIGGGIVPQVMGTNYSVSATADSTGIYPNGGNVLFTSSVVSTQVVVIDRQPIDTQTFNILQAGFISSVGLVHQLDYLTLLVQGLQDKMSRAITLPEGFGTTFNVNIPSNVAAQSQVFAGAFLGINSTATGIGIVNSSYIPYSPAPAGFLLTGNGPSTFPSFQPLSLNQSGVSGTLSLTNGGTGGLVPSEWGVVYASSATQLATTAPGPAGYPLVSNASSAPSFQALNLAVASGLLPVAQGGTGLGSYAGNHLLQSGSGGASVTESPITLVGSSVRVGDGSATVPSLAFINETNTGIYRTAAGDIVQMVLGVQGAEYLTVGTQVNVGFGVSGSVSSSNSVPFTISANNNQPDYFSLGNASTGTSSASLLQFFNGTSSNYVFIGNFANSAASNGTTGNGYLNGGGWLGSNNNMTQLVLSSDYSAGFIGFAVGGHDLPHERARMTGTSFTLNGGFNLILGGSGATAMALTLPATMASRNGDMIYCGSGGVFTQLAVGSSGTILQSNGVGSSPSWISNGSLSNPMSTLGDTIYGGAGGSATRLAGVTSNSTVFFTQTGSGGFATAPVWIPLSPPKTTVISVGSGGSTGTFTTPAGCLALKVFVVGPGGGGGGTASSAGGSGAGAGGGGGATAIKYFSGSSLLATYSYGVWGGANGGASGNNFGSAGSSCFFGSLVATGGLGGTGSANQTVAVVMTTASGGGSAFGGDINVPGVGGGAGIVLSAASALQGAGGDSLYGFGPQAGTGSGGGSNGTGYGSGGSGGVQSNNGGTQAGGAGAPGAIIVEQYFT